MIIAEARALALIPEELKSEDAAPLVCAGITTFNALRNNGRAGDTVAIRTLRYCLPTEHGVVAGGGHEEQKRNR